jgi:hypothetical protein
MVVEVGKVFSSSCRCGYHCALRWSIAMMARHTIFACSALLFACTGSAASAGQPWHWGHAGHWHAIRHAIYELENRIALLQADPEIDDGYKAPVISRARADTFRLRRQLGPAQWRWVSPCCYGRRSIYIR